MSQESAPRAYQDEFYGWCIRRTPRELELPGGTVPHPARTRAIFVVHGIGDQVALETAAGLRSGFEDALVKIEAWQRKQKKSQPQTRIPCISSPFVWEGYWANYTNIEETFPEDWQAFTPRERKFFSNLWRIRTMSAVRTYLWFLGQQLRLLNPALMFRNFLAWLLYLPLQVVCFFSLTFLLLRHPILLTRYLMDVRLYVAPQGSVERAIVQRIDKRVGEAFLRMLGLDWKFEPGGERIQVSGEELVFDRVVWVAHSLGTVISYNVLSDLFARARELESSGTDVQKKGVRKFRESLCRFVTLGSPLDKVAFLYPDCLRPWPEGDRSNLLTSGDALEDPGPDSSPRKEWWINFYHVMDPVSGALTDKRICADRPPSNFHIKSGWLAFVSHMAYWTDLGTLRFILGRTFGKDYLRDKPFRPWSAKVQTFLAVIGYVFWAGFLLGASYAALRWGPGWIADAVKALFRKTAD